MAEGQQSVIAPSDVCLQRHIAKKIFKSKIEARHVNAGHYMAFKHCISFATDLAANFGCNRFRIMPDIVSKLLRAAIWSRCAARLESEQTPFSWTGRRYLDLLLCTGFDSEHAVSFLCHISTQRPMNDRKMERSDWRGFGQQQLAQSIENFISQNSHEKKGDLSRPEIYKSLNLCWLLNWVSIARVVGYFPQASRTSAGRGPQRLSPTLKRPVFTRLSDPPKLCRSAAPRAWPSWH